MVQYNHCFHAHVLINHIRQRFYLEIALMDIFTKVSPGKILEISAIIRLKDFITVIVVLFVCKDNIVKLLYTIHWSIIVMIILNLPKKKKRRINHDKHTINVAIQHDQTCLCKLITLWRQFDVSGSNTNMLPRTWNINILNLFYFSIFCFQIHFSSSFSNFVLCICHF